MSDYIAAVEIDDWLALLFIGFLVLCVKLELSRPFLRPGLRIIKKSYFTNVFTYLLNDLTLSLLSIPSLYFVAQQFTGTGVLANMENGFVKYALTFVLLDLTMYVWHYITHHIDVLWVFHKVHHSDKTLNVTTGLRFHLGELIMEVFVRVAFIALWGVDPNVILVTQTLITLFVLFHHTNVTFPGEKALSLVFIVPKLHRVHHSVLREEHDSNYGAVFSAWDRMFGTLKYQEPTEIGLSGGEDEYIKSMLNNAITLGIVKQFKLLMTTIKPAQYS